MDFGWLSKSGKETSPEISEFAEEPSVDLQAPEGLRAASGELRMVPLKWEPLTTGDVGGYVVERAAERDGHFEELTRIPGRLATTYLDENPVPADPPVSAVPDGEPIDDEPIDGEPIDDEPIDGEPIDDEPIDGESIDGESTDGESTDGEPIDGESTDGESTDGESTDGEPIDGESAVSPDGITWFYQVRAYASDGRVSSRASDLAVATTALPPEAPEDLRAYSRQPRSVPLSWGASDDPNVVGYRVERSPTASGPFELLAEIDGRYETLYVDLGLGDLRVFYYRVVAVNAAGGLGVATAEPVRAVTKPEPLPPIGLRTVEQHLGANALAWDHNVEEDIVGYRLYRILEGEDSHTLISSLSADETTATDTAVAAGQRVFYTLVAIDRDGLESDPANPIEVESERYGLSATVRADGVHLEWNGRADEGFRGGHVFRTALLQNKNLGFSDGNSFVDTEVKAGATYRYTIVLERTNQSLAPKSAPVEISIPKHPAD